MTGTSPRVPAEGDQPDITLPDGEQIVDICTNAVPSTSSTVIDDDKLLIATYNPTVTDRKPGSLYLYDLRTMKKEKEWIGICEKPWPWPTNSRHRTDTVSDKYQKFGPPAWEGRIASYCTSIAW